MWLARLDLFAGHLELTRDPLQLVAAEADEPRRSVDQVDRTDAALLAQYVNEVVLAEGALLQRPGVPLPYVGLGQNLVVLLLGWSRQHAAFVEHVVVCVAEATEVFAALLDAATEHDRDRLRDLVQQRAALLPHNVCRCVANLYKQHDLLLLLLLLLLF